MSILNELVNGPGYVVTKINDLKKFDKLRKVLIKKMNFEEKDILPVRKKISNTVSDFKQHPNGMYSYASKKKIQMRWSYQMKN